MRSFSELAHPLPFRRRAKTTCESVPSHSKGWTCVAVWLLALSCLAPNIVATHHQAKHYVGAATKFFDFDISLLNTTRNCVNKAILAVNGQFPGPTIHITEGDNVVVKVTNSANANVTIHWHGVAQRLSSWHDGVGHVTQCSIQAGDYFIYNFTVGGQRGTTFWHAHVNWVRATVYGAFVTHPPSSYPFPQPYKEFVVILGEWWNGDVETIEKTTLAAGGPFPIANAATINGLPGHLHNCSTSEGVTNFGIEQGETYLLRIINAALNSAFYFGIANHELTVVEVDSKYVKPFTVEQGVSISPGQTMNVLVTANQPAGRYYMAAVAASSILITDIAEIPAATLPFLLHDVPIIPTTAVFHYVNSTRYLSSLPDLPAFNDSSYGIAFQNQLRNLHPETVTCENIRHLLFTIGTGTQPCTPAKPCATTQGPYRVVGEINNVTFLLPTTAILQAFYYNISGVYTPDFPDTPLVPYDYTNPDSPSLPQQVTTVGTRVTLLEYGTTVQLVLQANNKGQFQRHPFHLHGFFFYVLGQGFGNYDEKTDPATFNYYDPPGRFTVDVPTRGWVAIRFTADNPGAWLLHCHLEKHTSWGMQMVFLVKNGVGPDQTLPPPPPRLSQC